MLGINTSEPVHFALNFRKFCNRGGCSDVHKDGWDMCFFRHRGVLSFYDTAACCHSRMAQYVQDSRHCTSNMLAHIRYATQGEVQVENLHPFVRELWGIPWCFAHNGDLTNFANVSEHHHVLLGKSTADNLSFHAIGDTDSEAVFCAILNALKAEFRELPTLHQLHDFLLKLCNEIQAEGDIFNFILLSGPNTLFAYSWPGKRPTSTVWNGLYYLVCELSSSPSLVKMEDEDYSVQLPSTADTSCNTKTDNRLDPSKRMAIIATKPLRIDSISDSNWIEMKPRELLMFDRGVPLSKSSELDAIEREGRGLSSRCFPKAACPVCRTKTPVAMT